MKKLKNKVEVVRRNLKRKTKEIKRVQKRAYRRRVLAAADAIVPGRKGRKRRRNYALKVWEAIKNKIEVPKFGKD